MKDRVLLAAAVACVAAQFGGDIWLSVAALATWVLLILLLDRGALRRLLHWRFWLPTAALALLSGLLLGPEDLVVAGVGLSSEGLAAGGLMVVRASLFLGLASWAGRAAGRVRLRHALAGIGLEPLGRAVSVALAVLPEIRIRGPGRGGPFAAAVRLVRETVRLAEEIEAREAAGARPPGVRVLAVVGPPGSGKTGTVTGVASRLSTAGVRVGGVCQPADRAAGTYDVFDIASGESRRLARRDPGRPPGVPAFAFERTGWEFAAGAIRSARATADVVVADELGRLEAEGHGHMPALLGSMPQERARAWVLGVRADCADAVAARVGGFDEVLDVGPDAPARGEDTMREWLGLSVLVGVLCVGAAGCDQSVSTGGTDAAADGPATTRSLRVSLRGEERVAEIDDASPVALDALVKQAFPALDLGTVVADFAAADGFRPANSPNCKDLIPIPGPTLEKGHIDPATMNLSWDESLKYPGCMAVKDLAVVVLADP